VSTAKRENARLKKLLADRQLETDALKEVMRKNRDTLRMTSPYVGQAHMLDDEVVRLEWLKFLRGSDGCDNYS
jgi:hypothetical protein